MVLRRGTEPRRDVSRGDAAVVREVSTVDDDDSKDKHRGMLSGVFGRLAVVHPANSALHPAVATSVRGGHGSPVLACGGSLPLFGGPTQLICHCYALRIDDPEFGHDVDCGRGDRVFVRGPNRQERAPQID